ncbi:hypothetical protein [Tenacibaculum amylolyticum]|uniref:hypothetical protein n=1 Tax=Tenacibaculum amylolyticum TaxID=104269 RepID=UPI0038B4CA82
MKETFFRISDKNSYGRSSIQVDPIKEIDSLTMLNEDTILLKENSFKVNKGTKWLDVIPYESSMNFLISKRLKTALVNENVSGVVFFPTTIINHPEKEYYGLIINSLAGPILNLEKLNNYEDEHIDFDFSTWKKTDFFTLTDTLIFGITERIKSLLEKGKYSNIEIERL